MISLNASGQGVTPFIKWAGGKRWLAPFLSDLLRSNKGRHIEPFLGSGACFFYSPDTEAVLSDINNELINTYQVLRDQPNMLVNKLSKLTINKSTFIEFRRHTPNTKVGRAVRFIYLNRTAFNGLYRVNKRGEFNVPFGCKPSTKLPDSDTIYKCSYKLQNTTLRTKDFKEILLTANKHDRIYLDPPYTVKHNNNGFRHYNETLFNWENQVELARIAHNLAKQNILVAVSNAFHSEVLKLYSSGMFHLFALSRISGMSSSANKRGRCREALLISKTTHYNDAVLKVLLKKHFPSKMQGVMLF